MKAKELINNSVEELKNKLADLLKTHFSLRLKRSLSQLDKTSDIRATRRDIARVRSVLHSKGVR